MLKKYSHLLGKNKLAVICIIIGAISWSLTMVKSGANGFWGPNGHDGVWHIALANSFSRGSLEMPNFAGEQLRNYHIGFDLMLSFVNRITSIPTHVLYFQLLPPIIALGVGIASYYFVYLWRKSKREALLSTFFVYFGGSLGWIFGKGESMFWSQQSISTLINPPFALSLLVIFMSLILLQKRKWILAAILISCLVQIKVYAGILTLGGLFLSGIFLYYKKKDSTLIRPFLVAFPLSLILFFPLNTGSSSLIVWQPFWFLETMMGLSDRVGWNQFYEAMSNYKLGNNYPKLIATYIVSFTIFIVGNFGTRLFFVKKIIPKDWISVFLLTNIVFGLIFPMLFLQSGTPWNTIQFFYYSLIFSGILAGVSLSEINNRYLTYIMLLLTLPTTYITLMNNYLPGRPPAYLSIAEQDALNFLKGQPDGVVLTYPYDAFKAKEAESNPPRPLYLYESTAYVSAFSNKTVFLEDQVNLDIMNYPWKERREEIDKFYSSLDEEYVYNFLREKEIKYIYWVKPQRAAKGETQLGIEKIYENKEVDVYRVIE